MNRDELLYRPITELAALIRGRRCEAERGARKPTSPELRGWTPPSTPSREPPSNSPEHRAGRLDAGARTGELYRGPLHGIPIALKDLLDLKGHPTTAGSRILGKTAALVDGGVRAQAHRSWGGHHRKNEFAGIRSRRHRGEQRFRPGAKPLESGSYARAEAAAARPPAWRREWRRQRLVPTPAARCACPLRSVIWWASAPRMAG